MKNKKHAVLSILSTLALASIVGACGKKDQSTPKSSAGPVIESNMQLNTDYTAEQKAVLDDTSAPDSRIANEWYVFSYVIDNGFKVNFYANFKPASNSRNAFLVDLRNVCETPSGRTIVAEHKNVPAVVNSRSIFITATGETTVRANGSECRLTFESGVIQYSIQSDGKRMNWSSAGDSVEAVLTDSGLNPVISKSNSPSTRKIEQTAGAESVQDSLRRAQEEHDKLMKEMENLRRFEQ